MINQLEFVGQIFDRLEVTSFYGINKDGHSLWNCLCSCGMVCIKIGKNLKLGRVKSCGCLKKEILGMSAKTHGMFGTKFYGVWAGMLTRCTNLRNKDYPTYGGRGIKVCSRWLESFENFRDDMHKSYLEHIEEFGRNDTSIDRIEVMGNYEPSNCRWATKEEQMQNRRSSAKTENYKLHRYFATKLTNFVNTCLYRNINSKAFLELVGIPLPEFKQYIEYKFLPGMTWGNRGRCKIGVVVWNLDHEVGCNKFDLSKREEQLKCFNYKNYQPLWWKDNLAKRFIC